MVNRKKLAVKKKPVSHQARNDCETNSPCRDYSNCADECEKNMQFDFKIERVSLISIWYPFVFV